MPLDPLRPVGQESRKSYGHRCETEFWDRYITGPNVLDIGYQGGLPDAVPIIEGAVGIELGYPGYNGFHLPFVDNSQDAVHASHVLEHVTDPVSTVREWFRVLKTGGHLILFVPHAYLYERREFFGLRSHWSPEHYRSYTPGDLLMILEEALTPNHYRIRHMADCDNGYRYDLPPTVHPEGCLEIELVVQKIAPPSWKVEAV